MAKRKTYSAAFKSKVALEAIQGDLPIAELSGKYQVSPTLVSKWKQQAIEGMAHIFSRGGRRVGAGNQDSRIKGLHAKIGELTVERDFLAKTSVVEPRPEDGHDRSQSPKAQHRAPMFSGQRQPLIVLLPGLGRITAESKAHAPLRWIPLVGQLWGQNKREFLFFISCSWGLQTWFLGSPIVLPSPC